MSEIQPWLCSSCGKEYPVQPKRCPCLPDDSEVPAHDAVLLTHEVQAVVDRVEIAVNLGLPSLHAAPVVMQLLDQWVHFGQNTPQHLEIVYKQFELGVDLVFPAIDRPNTPE